MSYIVEVYCGDCTGSDDLGCNDGSPWYVYDDDYATPRVFATYAEAEAAGWKAVSDVGPWRFEVKEHASAAQEPKP